jgi:hypothetical protein
MELKDEKIIYSNDKNEGILLFIIKITVTQKKTTAKLKRKEDQKMI